MAEPELNIEDPRALVVYLRERGHVALNEQPVIETLAGGVSNRTVRVRRDGAAASTSGGWVLKQALAKLRVAVDWFSDPKRVHREALGIRWLGELAPAGSIPQLVFEDEAQHLIAMSAVPEPHVNWKSMLLAGDVQSAHVDQFAQLLAQVHREAHRRRDELQPIFADTGYFESLRLEPYYGYSAQQAPEAADFLSQLIESTRQRGDTLVHGDYSPKNILVHDGRLVLLDHEVIHWGDPAFDLGFSMTHLLSKAHHLSGYRDAFADAARRYWRVYRETLGDVPFAGELESRAVRHTLACLLARVAGRSPLEYLNDDERTRQQRAVTQLMRQPAGRVAALIDDFLTEL